MSAKNAELQRTGSHYVSDDVSSQCAEGIGKEQVHGYFSATWRGKPVSVTVAADRYAASHFSSSHSYTSTNRLTEWRAYASEAHFVDETRNGGRGDAVSATARAALGNLCVPLMLAWLDTDAYTVSFQRAAAHLIMRKFRDDYSATRRVAEALSVFQSRLTPTVVRAIRDTLDAYRAYEALKARADQIISGEAI